MSSALLILVVLVAVALFAVATTRACRQGAVADDGLDIFGDAL